MDASGPVPAPESGRSGRPYGRNEEIANSVTHGLGVALGVASLVLMTVVAVRGGGGVRLAAALVFGVSLILLYSASTLYHAFPQPRVKHIFKMLDHAAIYLLIAGTYTPFTLIALRGQGGALLFWVEWGLAAFGMALEAFWAYRPRWLSVAVYLAMGWLAILLIRPLADTLPAGGVWLLVAGGLSYSVGTVFYIIKRVPYFHAIWHLFVLGGSACHVLGVLLFVL